MHFNDNRPCSSMFHMYNVVSCMHIAVNACDMCMYIACLLVSCKR